MGERQARDPEQVVWRGMLWGVAVLAVVVFVTAGAHVFRLVRTKARVATSDDALRDLGAVLVGGDWRERALANPGGGVPWLVEIVGIGPTARQDGSDPSTWLLAALGDDEMRANAAALLALDPGELSSLSEAELSAATSLVVRDFGAHPLAEAVGRHASGEPIAADLGAGAPWVSVLYSDGSVRGMSLHDLAGSRTVGPDAADEILRTMCVKPAEP